MKTKTDFSAKPYNRCLFCHHRKEKRCDGARSSAMELARWCEYMHDMKEVNEFVGKIFSEKSLNESNHLDEDEDWNVYLLEIEKEK